MSRPARTIAVAAAALAVAAATVSAVTAVGTIAVPEFDRPAAVVVETAPPGVGTGHATLLAADALATLEIKGRAPRTGYDRDQFGQGWGDRDHDGCDTRAEILRRDAVESTFSAAGCIADLTIRDPYSGELVTGRAEIDIDHVVALGDAWQTGAQQLTADEREALANDHLNLLAVDDGLNRQKSDSDAASWLPPDRTYWCDYVARQIAVKVTYRLWVTAAEHDTMGEILAGCPGEPLPAEAP